MLIGLGAAKIADMRFALGLISTTIALLAAAPTQAVCSGASLEQEYREADLVVRAVVVAETRVTDDEPSAAFRARWGDYSPVVLSRLRVLEVFKGAPGTTINFFQGIDSGRFDVDLGREYLVFFHYYPGNRGLAAVTRGAVYVRHACGQSKPWSEVGREDLARLRTLSSRR